MTRLHLRVALAIAAAIMPCTVAAQDLAPSRSDSSRVIETRVQLTPPLFEALPGTSANLGSLAVAVPRQLSQGQTLMIIGGSALLAGVLIGDDAGTLLVLGGVAIGGYGLYLHLNRGTR